MEGDSYERICIKSLLFGESNIYSTVFMYLSLEAAGKQDLGFIYLFGYIYY